MKKIFWDKLLVEVIKAVQEEVKEAVQEEHLLIYQQERIVLLSYPLLIIEQLVLIQSL